MKTIKYKFIIIFLSDIIIIAVSFILAYYLREKFYAIQSLSFYYNFLMISIVSFLLISVLLNLYSKNISFYSLTYFVNYIKALCYWGIFLIFFSFFTKNDYSRIVVVSFFIFTCFLTYACRILLTWIFKENKPKNGDGDIYKEAQKLISTCSENSNSNLQIFYSYRNPGVAYKILNTIFNWILSFFGLLMLILIYPVVYAMIKKDSKGKIIFTQRRIGKEKKEFMIYKFRTMYENTEKYNFSPRTNNDQRITKTGKILRQYSLDELPQLWNVLKGDMSIVGPRPEMPFIVEKYKPWQELRLKVKPGITGLWQILGRKDLPLEENLEYDLYYIFNQSIFLDLAILLKTIPHLILPRGAY